MNKKRILYISEAILPSNSANSVHVMKMCEAFANHGHEVCLIAIKGARNDDVFKFYGIENKFQLKLYNLPNVPLKLYLKAFLSLVFIKRFKPDYIFGRSFHSIAFQSLFFKIPFGFELHGPVSSLRRHFQISLNKIVSSKNFTHLVVISAVLKEIIQSELDNRINIQVLHDGATIMKDPSKVDVIKTFNSTLNIGYFGTIGYGRGIDLIADLSIRMPNLDFHIFGSALDEFQALYPSIPIKDNLHFYGFLDPQYTQYLRSQCDVLLAPYQKNLKIKSGKNTSEYMSPIKIFEYMSANKALVASDLPSIREVLNESNSIMVPSDEVNSWEIAINRLQDTRLRAKLANNAFNDFKNNFTWNKRASFILDYIGWDYSQTTN